MKVFLDCEFTGLHQHTTLISIGLVSEDNRMFYAEFNDYDDKQVDNWIRCHVISNLMYNNVTKKKNQPIQYILAHHQEDRGFAHDVLLYKPHCTFMSGTKFEIATFLQQWIHSFNNTIEIWGDCIAHDWVLFHHLLTTHNTPLSNDAFSSPPSIPNVYPYPFDICTLFKIANIDPDTHRESFVDDVINESSVMKHNALHDAKVIRLCYDKLITIINSEPIHVSRSPYWQDDDDKHQDQFLFPPQG